MLKKEKSKTVGILQVSLHSCETCKASFATRRGLAIHRSVHVRIEQSKALLGKTQQTVKGRAAPAEPVLSKREKSSASHAPKAACAEDKSPLAVKVVSAETSLVSALPAPHHTAPVQTIIIIVGVLRQRNC